MQLTPFGTSPRSALALVPAAVAQSLASAPSHPSLTAELPPLEGAAAVEALAGSSSPSRVLNPAVVGANDSGWFIPRIAASTTASKVRFGTVNPDTTLVG